MKFSILIANYNNGKFFKDCYQSIISQTYQDWEAIILDDKSTDDSLNVIREMVKGDERFKIFEMPQNSGVGIVKAKLIELATGKICSYVDPDDAIKQNAITSAIEVFKNKPDTVLTYSRFIKCDSELKEISENKSAYQVLNGDKHFFNCPIVIKHFVCFRKDVYLKTEKMNPDMKIAEDQDLYLKMYEKGNVIFIDEANYLYRTHSGGISQNENKAKSYEYWGEVIFNAMKRRGLKTINGKKIPAFFKDSQEIFDLLKYQTGLKYRLLSKLKSIFQTAF